MRRGLPVLVVAVWVMVAGCSGSDPATDPAAVPAASVTSSVADPGAAPTTLVAADDAAGTVDPAAAAPVRVDMAVELESIGLDIELSADALDSADPFGRYGSCSGWRRAFGPYSVWVSSPDGQVRAVSVVTAGSVTQPGIASADVRVELRSGEVALASGTVTIGAGWRSGTFVAFGADGAEVRGSFECTGGDPDSAPLDLEDTTGVLDSIEVIALLRGQQAERVVGLAVQTERSPGVAVECPAADEADGVVDDGQIVVRVDGDQAIGSLTSFELVDGDAATMQLGVGGVSYRFDDVVITLAESAASGTFSATADDLTVDGAFRCI